MKRCHHQSSTAQHSTLLLLLLLLLGAWWWVLGGWRCGESPFFALLFIYLKINSFIIWTLLLFVSKIIITNHNSQKQKQNVIVFERAREKTKK